MKILAIETATEACSAALLISDESGQSQKIYVRFQHAPRAHTQLILPMLDEVLAEAGIELSEVDAIAFGRGPGAFTGLRIASGVAQGIALSVNKPVIPVSTLATLAQSVVDKLDDAQSIMVALDARMNEVYWAEFVLKQERLALQGEEQVSNAKILLESVNEKQKTIAIGNGWEAYLSDLPTNIIQIKDTFPSAKHVAQLALPLLLSGKSLPPEEAQPVYIRNNVAKKSATK